jgi:hypothetical protein
MYCVYITFYLGNKLPPFYIGSTTVDNIINGYRGSVSSRRYKKIWEKELTENPELFKTSIIKMFNNRLEAYEHEKKLHNAFNVKTNDLYANTMHESKDTTVVYHKQDPNLKYMKRVYKEPKQQKSKIKKVTYARIYLKRN